MICEFANPKAHAPIFQATALGISWVNILGWIAKYGLPILLQVLTLLMSGNLSGLTIQQIVTWVNQALEAIANGKTPPPVPTV